MGELRQFASDWLRIAATFLFIAIAAPIAWIIFTWPMYLGHFLEHGSMYVGAFPSVESQVWNAFALVWVICAIITTLALISWVNRND